MSDERKDYMGTDMLGWVLQQVDAYFKLKPSLEQLNSLKELVLENHRTVIGYCDELKADNKKLAKVNLGIIKQLRELGEMDTTLLTNIEMNRNGIKRLNNAVNKLDTWRFKDTYTIKEVLRELFKFRINWGQGAIDIDTREERLTINQIKHLQAQIEFYIKQLAKLEVGSARQTEAIGVKNGQYSGLNNYLRKAQEETEKKEECKHLITIRPVPICIYCGILGEDLKKKDSGGVIELKPNEPMGERVEGIAKVSLPDEKPPEPKEYTNKLIDIIVDILDLVGLSIPYDSEAADDKELVDYINWARKSFSLVKREDLQFLVNVIQRLYNDGDTFLSEEEGFKKIKEDYGIE